jgi:hypothetical protein
MTTSEIQRAAWLAERNLGVIAEGLALLASVPESERTPPGETFPLELGVRTLEELMNVYFAFGGDARKFRKYVREKARRATTYEILTRQVSYAEAPRTVQFCEETDLLLKETAAALGLLCRHLLLAPPGPCEGRMPGQVTLAEWEVRDTKSLAQARSVARAALIIYRAEGAAERR